MASVIVAAPPFTGELAPLLEIARGLVGRGHAVTLVTGSRFGAEVRATGADFVALTGAADLDDRRLAEHPEAAQVRTNTDQLNFLFSLVADAIPEEHRLLQDLLADDPEAVLITNSVFLGAWAVALGAPGRRPRRWVAVGANPVMAPSDDTTPLGPAPVGADGDQVAANRAANRQVEESLEPARQRIERAVRSLRATSPVPGVLAGVAGVPDVFAALSVPGMEFARGDAPAALHLVGPLPAPAPEGWVPPPWWGDLDDGRPVVVVTQGTLDDDDLGQLVRPTLEGLEHEDVLVVAVLGGRGAESLPGTVPANARVEPYLPFGHLLPHVDVLVTNGGFGGTQQALAARVPVVVAGATEDEPFVAARVTAAGVGRDLCTATPEPPAVREAVLAVLDDPEVRRRTERLAAEYAAHDAVDRVERLALGV